MADGCRPIVVPDEVYDLAQKYYEENKAELKLKYGVRSLTGYLNFCIREYLKEKGIIQV
jgi:radical SAM superfamily enzyme